MKKLVALFLILAGTAVLADADGSGTLEVAPSVDLSRYAGKWYEVARLPNRFQQNCVGEVTATYSLLPDNKLRVVNACNRENGLTMMAEGKARLASQSGPNSKLKVRFAPAWLSWLPAVWGDYWIIDLAPDYSYSVVGTQDRKYLWILSRTQQMNPATYDQIIQRMSAKGFDVTRLVKTRQSN